MWKKITLLDLSGHKLLFYTVLLFNIILVLIPKYYPSLDGPAHLYNSNLIKEIVSGDTYLQDFFSFNSIYIPNWTSHFSLALLKLFFPGWIAEKLFIIFLIAGMAFSFRYMLKQLNNENLYLSVLIFPFIFSFLFHLGFYNFSIGFVFLFLAIGYYIKFFNSLKLKNGLVLFLLFIATYYSNILLYAFLGFTLGIFTLFSIFINYKDAEGSKLVLKDGLRKLLILGFSALPTLIFAAFFFLHAKFFSSEKRYPMSELISWVNDARPFIVYDYSSDKLITEQYFHLILILVVLIFVNWNKLDRVKRLNNFLLVPTSLTLMLYFLIPDGNGAGMMSDRLILMFYIFLLAWVCSVYENKKIGKIVIIVMVFLHIGLQMKHMNGVIKNLSQQANTIAMSKKYINSNSLVLPINLTDNWLMHHFSNYIGIDQSVIVLENYEASVGWFPLTWEENNFPNLQLGQRNTVEGMNWKNNINSDRKLVIDNVLIYGDLLKLEDPIYSGIMEILNLEYRIAYRSADNFVLLYERKVN